MDATAMFYIRKKAGKNVALILGPKPKNDSALSQYIEEIPTSEIRLIDALSPGHDLGRIAVYSRLSDNYNIFESCLFQCAQPVALMGMPAICAGLECRLSSILTNFATAVNRKRIG